jgi:predicted nucleotidyltransferase
MNEEEDRRIAEILGGAVPDLLAIYRFGSTARKAERPGSDVDIAVLAATRLPAAGRHAAQEALAEALRRDVDLIDLLSVPTVLRMQVVSTGELIADRDPQERRSFETYVFADYARLNEERREILDRVGRERRVYAG